jgi:hypothetical protein
MTYIAGWNNATNNWFQLGSTSSQGVNDFVYSLALDPSNQFLYVGGNFTTVNDSVITAQSARYVVYWNIITQRWQPFGIDASNGFNFTARSIVLDSNYNRVYVGGEFTNAKDASSSVLKITYYVAYWDLVNKTWFA